MNKCVCMFDKFYQTCCLHQILIYHNTIFSKHFLACMLLFDCAGALLWGRRAAGATNSSCFLLEWNVLGRDFPFWAIDQLAWLHLPLSRMCYISHDRLRKLACPLKRTMKFFVLMISTDRYMVITSHWAKWKIENPVTPRTKTMLYMYTASSTFCFIAPYHYIHFSIFIPYCFLDFTMVATFTAKNA
jgi:hypothetical protein